MRIDPKFATDPEAFEQWEAKQFDQEFRRRQSAMYERWAAQYGGLDTVSKEHK